MFSLYTEQQYLGVRRWQEGIAETLSSNNPTDSQINAFLRREERLQAYEFVHCKAEKESVAGKGLTIGKTRLLTNQLGYICNDEHKGFVPTAIIQI